MPLLAIVLLTGCIKIPPEAIALNQKVSDNVTILKNDILKLIDAWETTGHTMIDNQWNVVYANAAVIYNGKSNEQKIETGFDPALKDQNIAKIASTIIQKAKAEVSEKAKKMRSAIESKTQTVVFSNDAITRLLTSANAVATTRTSVLNNLEDLPSIEIPDIGELIVN